MAWQSELASHAAAWVAHGPLSAQLVQSEQLEVAWHTEVPASLPPDVPVPLLVEEEGVSTHPLTAAVTRRGTIQRMREP